LLICGGFGQQQNYQSWPGTQFQSVASWKKKGPMTWSFISPHQT
jgi:hypothetical protein